MDVAKPRPRVHFFLGTERGEGFTRLEGMGPALDAPTDVHGYLGIFPLQFEG